MPIKTTDTKASRTEAHKNAKVRPNGQTSALSVQQATVHPDKAAPSDIIALQKMAGNRAVARWIQTKLAVGPAHDPYEQEADRVAQQVMAMPAPARTQPTVQRAPEEEEELQMKPLAASITPLVQRQAEEEEELQMKPEVQRAAGGAGFVASNEFEQRLAASRGSGSPLPDGVRSFMEPRFGADFGGVRVHTGSNAVQLNRDVSAQAFTHGQDIYLGEGKADLESEQGRQLLAHELTHVVQQNGTGQVQRSVALHVIQRDILTDWETQSSIPGKFWGSQSRSKELKAIGEAVKVLVDTAPGLWDQIVSNGQVVLGKITAWRTAAVKKEQSLSVKIKLLEDTVIKKVADTHEKIEKKRRDVEASREPFERFKTLEPDLAQYASRRSDIQQEEFEPDKLKEGGTYYALAMPRGTKGELSTEAVEMLTKKDYEMFKSSNIDKAAAGGITGADKLTPKEIQDLMEANKNKYTSQTQYPELQNLLEDTGKEDKDVTETKDASGVSVTVTYNPSDAMFLKRFALVEAAIKQLKTAGFEVPAFKLYLPKYGRKLEITTNNHKHEIRSTGESNASIFAAPDTIYISSMTYQNPKVATGLSIQLDPSGVASFIHEMGHFLHYHNAPGKFQGLSFTSFKGNEPTTGKPWAQFIAEKVSQYGSGNPREVVAELILGMAYNKTFDDSLLKMYKAFGGPIPKGQEAKFGSI